MTWILFTFAVLFEVAGTTAMKLSAGLTKIVPTILIFVNYAISFTLLTLVLKRIDLGVAYAIWSGIGLVLVVGVGILFFKESVTLLKGIGFVLIIVGVILLKVSE